MAQSSGPTSQGTLAERQFTDVLWRARFSDGNGVLNDLDGSAYQVALSTDSDVASIGSTTQDSLAVVAGFSHRIPVSQPEGITVPAAVGSARTDVIALRYDPTYSGAPGPVRLVLLSGNSATNPTYDATAPGVEELPLWAITRNPGQSLSQATVVRLFARRAPVLQVDAGEHLPKSAPLGTLVHRGTEQYLRELSAQSVAVWAQKNESTSSTPTMASGWSGSRALAVEGKTATVSLELTRTGGTFTLSRWFEYSTLLTGLPAPRIGQHPACIPPTNQSEFGAWQLQLTASGDLRLNARWRDRQWLNGGWVSANFTYVTL